MLVDIAQIPGEGLDLCIEEKGPPPAGLRVTPVGVVAAKMHLHRMPTEVSVEGEVRSQVELTCSRCSESFAVAVGEPFVVRYVRPGRGGAEERELAPEDMDVEFLEGDQIDVTRLLWENLELALPAQPLCSDGCRGLCPRCGVNLNVTACGCLAVETDPRWEVLRRLR